MIGSVFAAKRLALALFDATPLRCASASFGPPSFLPSFASSALSAASAAFVRALMASRSCSATAARIWMVSLLAWGKLMLVRIKQGRLVREMVKLNSPRISDEEQSLG